MLQPACSSHLTAPSVHGSRIRGSSRTLQVSAALSASPSTPTAAKPPRIQRKLHVDRMFQEVHEEMTARGLRVAHAKNLLVDAYYFRHPEDVWAILSKDDVLFAKSARMTATREWLGDGVFTQLDPDRHAAGRALLNPAFRRDYLAQLDSFMIGSAQQLADILTAAAVHSGNSSTDRIIVSTAGRGSSTVRSNGSTVSAIVAPLDMQRLFRLLTLDTLGLTSLDRSFDALQLWQQQQQDANAQTASTAASSSSSSNGQLELEQLLWDLESAFLLFSLRLPVPRSWLPGWSKYIRACERLDSTINSILQETRTQQQQQQQQQASCTGGAEHSPGSTSAAPPSSSSSSRQTLVSFLLAAQQQQGADQIPDQQILDEIKTVMFGGVDTSAFTLAVCAHFLAQHPAAADRAAAEVAALLRGSGRSSVGQLRAGDASKLPWVLACVNETMRLVPAGPAITRTALQDVELAGVTIPRGQTVVANLYSMHRHPEVWPQPDAWLPQRWIPAEAAAAGLTTRSSSTSSSDTSSSGSSSSSKAQQQPFLPFSTGPRGCIGRNYGLLQMVLGLSVLLGSGVRFELPAGEQGRPLPFTKSMTLHVKGGIWLVPRTADIDGGV